MQISIEAHYPVFDCLYFMEHVRTQQNAVFFRKLAPFENNPLPSLTLKLILDSYLLPTVHMYTLWHSNLDKKISKKKNQGRKIKIKVKN